MTDLQKEMIFAISHILREFGFRKESTHYFVKPKGDKATLLRMNLSNHWNLKHYDWNGVDNYTPSMCKTWDFNGTICIPLYSEFEKSGYICSVPSCEQILSFSETQGFEIRMGNVSETLADLIAAYREKKNKTKAFEKYMKLNTE